MRRDISSSGETLVYSAFPQERQLVLSILLARLQVGYVGLKAAEELELQAFGLFRRR
jgi:hypothetical protein